MSRLNSGRVLAVSIAVLTYSVIVMAFPENYTLELVQVLFRHGARTCSKSEAAIPMPTYIDQVLHDTYGYEQLTNIGKSQAYKLGCVLRKRYNDYLGATYDNRHIYAYCSDTDRTKMSLQLVLSGLYPPKSDQIWNHDLKWLPIPFHYVPRELDVLLKANEKSKYRQLLRDVRKSPEVQQKISELMEMNPFFESKGIHALNKHLLYGSMGIFNVLSIHKAANASLPDWYSDELLEKLKEYVVYELDIRSKTPEMIKLDIGPLIKRFIDNMNINNEFTNPRKIYLYSGHEINIAAFLRAHKIDHFKYPEFANAIILEKFRDSHNQLYVRFIYWYEKDNEFVKLKLGNFEEFCPIEDFLKLNEYVVPTNEELQSIFTDIKIDFQNITTTDFVFRPEYY